MPSGRSERRSGYPRRGSTLRFRLTFWNTVGLLVLTAATMIGLRQGLYVALSRDLSRLTAEDAAEVALEVERAGPTAPAVAALLDLKAQSGAGRDWFGRVRGLDNAILAESPGAPILPWPADPPTGPFDLAGYRVLQRTVARPGGPPVVVRVGSSLRFVTEDVDTLTRVILLAGGAVLLVAPPVGYWLAGRATRPLQTIIATTDRLRPGALAERLPLRGTGDELDQLSATINGFLDRLADHLARQRDFVANAAHELRSPLAAVRTAVDVALQRDRSPGEYQDLLADVAEEAADLSGLVNQLLLLAEGDADRLRPGKEVVSLADLAARAADMFQGLADQRGVTLAVTQADRAAVRGDAGHLRQVIHNLLDNALKFTPAGGRVELAVSATAETAILTVRDTGVGIAPADLPHVGDRFFQADRARARDGEVRGTGLGLSICRAIVTAYGGRMNVASEPGRGTTVTVELPPAG